MNDRVALPTYEESVGLPSATIWQALRLLLASAAFAKAPRMRDLLCFLVQKKLDNEQAALTEQTVAIQVFRRDARLYDPALDPIVRVQIGRLRSRLTAYYASVAAPAGVRFAIPFGSYVPSILPAPEDGWLSRQGRLELAPLRNLTAEHGGDVFASGLDDELCARLFQAFGGLVQPHERQPRARTDAGPVHLLEGSVRVEQDRVRASLRLIDTASGHIAWLSQFDRRGLLGIRLQEELATAICEELKRFLRAP